jgi:uncharacterized protein (DUF1697 family)
VTDRVALLRGINVGTAKRVPMAELRAVCTSLGYTDVVTLLNSGNVVFAAASPPDAGRIRAAVLEATGVDADLVVLDAARFAAVAEANPLRSATREAKRLGVAFAQAPLRPGDVAVPAGLEPDGDDATEELVVAEHAVYQWLPDGVLASAVPPAFWKALGTPVTARNDATVRKIVALLESRA